MPDSGEQREYHLRPFVAVHSRSLITECGGRQFDAGSLSNLTARTASFCRKTLEKDEAIERTLGQDIAPSLMARYCNTMVSDSTL